AYFFLQAEDGIRAFHVTGVQTCALPIFFGVSTYIRSRARDLADLGYVVLAPELYWRLGETVDESRDDVLEQGMALAGRLDWGQTVADSVAALDALRARPEVTGGVGAVGRSEEHTSELQSRENLVCRLLLEKKKSSNHKI